MGETFLSPRNVPRSLSRRQRTEESPFLRLVPPPVWPFSSAASAVASEWSSGGKRVEIVVRMSGAAAGGEESRRGRKCQRIFRSPRTMMEKKAVRKKSERPDKVYVVGHRNCIKFLFPRGRGEGRRSPLHQVAVGKKTAADKKGIPLPLLLLFGPMDPRYDLTWRRRRRRKPDSSVRYRLTGSPPPPFPSSAKPPPPPPGRKEGEIA